MRTGSYPAAERVEELEFQVRRMTQEYEEVSDSLRRENEKWKRACAERVHYRSALLLIAEGASSEWAGGIARDALAAWRKSGEGES